MNTQTAMSLARRLAQISPRAKMWVMAGCDALFLPWCMLAAVGFRLGSLEQAFTTAPVVQISLALLTLPLEAASTRKSM